MWPLTIVFLMILPQQAGGSEQTLVSSLEFGVKMLFLYLQSHDAKGMLIACFYIFKGVFAVFILGWFTMKRNLVSGKGESQSS